MRDSDLERVVTFSLDAWEPVFSSFERILGPRIFQAVYPDWRTLQADGVRSACQDPGNVVWVATVDERPVGFVVTQDERDGDVNAAGIYMIAVDPAHQRQGIGDSLLGHAVAELRAQGVEVVSIQTGGEEGHAPARALYEKRGFRAVPLAVYYLQLQKPAAAREPNPTSRTSTDPGLS